ncbi:MAG: ATP-binding protein [Candidatus Azambacteria bacterium]|nr:ATP-binding protein [Candidatus Azambacteria bacterium]
METKDLHKRLDREMLEALVEVQGKIDKLEFEEMLEFLVNKIIKTLKIERCSIFRVFPEFEKVRLATGEPKDGHGLGMEFFFKDLEAIREVVGSKSYLLILEPWQDERTKQSRELIYHKGISAILFIPLVVENEVAGIIVLDATKEKKTFSQEDLYFCLTLSNLVSLLLERDLVHQEREEKKTLIILGQAAAEAAHQMRNPLVPIGGFARRLAKKEGFFKRLIRKIFDPKYKKYAEIIVRETERLESILEGLLRFSRQKKARVILSDLNEIIREAEKIIVEGLIKEKQIRIELKLSPEIPFLLVDSMEIRDMFLDILRNAVEAIEKEGVISIRSEKGENKVKIFISNTGCIDEEIINHIVNPFFTTKPGGSGLGLASVIRTLDAYGGELKVVNDTQARQATFVIKLPFQ